MTLYSQSKFANVSMIEAPGFVKAIPKHDIIIETGTHKGTGSTRMLASTTPDVLITMEANYNFFVEAVENLKQFEFVQPYWGLSVNREEAIDFIRENQDYNIPGVFVDSLDPIPFYLEEIGVKCRQEELLEMFLEEYKDENPLILLDSAGGIGYLEFLTVQNIMGERPHTLILDDTHHVKHYRSRLDALARYRVLYDNIERGCSIFTK